MPFVKGKSGNPGGRKKITQESLDLEASCKKLTPQALDTIVAIMQGGDNERNRLTAAQYIVDRGYGKPIQAVSGKDGEAIQHDMTVTFIRKIIDG
jgi:hypothetical protein